MGYRRADTADAAGRVYDQLEAAFGAKNLFKDVDAMPLGVEFRSFVTRVIKSSNIFLILIGPDWLAKRKGKPPRLFDPDDLVRIEIETALSQEHVHVIPMLLSGAQMPARQELPESIAPIVNLNAAIVRQDPDFRKDMRKLIVHLKSLPEIRATKRQKSATSMRPVTARPKQTAPSSDTHSVRRLGHNISSVEANIGVVGIGGAGLNAVDNMIDASLLGAEFFALSPDPGALKRCKANNRLLLQNPNGEDSENQNRNSSALLARENADLIRAALEPCDLIFLAAGLGGSTGTGATPIVAHIARSMKKTVIAVVNLPFGFEGKPRSKVAKEGLKVLQTQVDALLVVPNQKLFSVADEKTTFAQAFKLSDDVLYRAIRSVVDLTVMPGLINLDLEDLVDFFKGFGRGVLGTASADASDLSDEVVSDALKFALMENANVGDVGRALVNITGGYDIDLFRVDDLAQKVRAGLPNAYKVIIGSTFDPRIKSGVMLSIWGDQKSKSE